MQKSSKVLNIIIGVLYALLGIIWLISGISSLGNVQILLGTNILTYVCVLLPLLIVFAVIGISLYRLKKNESTGLIALLWVRFLARMAFPSASCSVIVLQAEPAKSPEPIPLQKIQPPYPILPSRFGQVIPPFNAMRYTFSPNWDFNA